MLMEYSIKSVILHRVELLIYLAKHIYKFWKL